MKIENSSKTEDNLVTCKNCYVNFRFNENIVFTQKSKHCKQHDFTVPDHIIIDVIHEPCFFVRKKTKNELNIENAKKQLKQSLVALLYDFTNKTCSPNNVLYPYCLPIIKECLSECLDEVEEAG